MLHQVAEIVKGVSSTSNTMFLCPGLPKHQSDQNLHGDWTYSHSPQLGEPL